MLPSLIKRSLRLPMTQRVPICIGRESTVDRYSAQTFSYVFYFSGWILDFSGEKVSGGKYYLLDCIVELLLSCCSG